MSFLGYPQMSAEKAAPGLALAKYESYNDAENHLWAVLVATYGPAKAAELRLDLPAKPGPKLAEAIQRRAEARAAFILAARDVPALAAVLAEPMAEAA